MCISAAAAWAASLTVGEAVAVGAAAATVATTAVSVLNKPKQAAQSLLDPKIARAKAETEAAQANNSKLAAKNRSRAASSLLAKPLDSTTSDVSALGGGKTTLGQ